MLRLGQEVEITEAYEAETIIGGEKMQVVEGDKAVVTLQGLKYITGEAYGKYAPLQEVPIGYDIMNIANRIAKNLVLDLGGQDFLNYLEELELELRDVEESILEELSLFIPIQMKGGR